MNFKILTGLILILFISKQYEKKTTYLDLTKSIMEKEDLKQLNSFDEKIISYEKDPSTVFFDDIYCYDTRNRKFQNCRGTSEELKNNVYWFLLIDNLQLGNYIYEFDWKQPENEILGIINSLAKKKGYTIPNIPSTEYDKQLDAGERLSLYNKTLKINGFTLINLYIDSDSYVTALIELRSYNNIVKLAKISGNKVSQY